MEFQEQQTINGSVYFIQIMTDMQSRPITRTSIQTTDQKTLEKFGVEISQDTTSSVQDFLARHLVLQERGKDFLKLVELYSLKYAELQNITDLNIYSLKMLKDFYLTIKGEHLPSFSPRWTNWGMMLNGKCLTLNTSEFRRTGKECSLSDILEANPDQKYFLSDKAVKKLIRHQNETSNTSSRIQEGLAMRRKEELEC